MSSDPTQPASEPPVRPAGSSEQLSEEELRAAYEEELSRITTSDLALQAAVSLLNLGGRRLGLAGAPGQPPDGERDLEQVRDAIDAVRALLEILERRRAGEVRPLRDALSQLQMAYAREASAAAQGPEPSAGQPPGAKSGAGPGEQEAAAEPGGAGEQGKREDGSQEPDTGRGPGPAESSGRLWVPGR